MKNETGTLPAVGPFTPTANRPRKPEPRRCFNKHVEVKCGDKPGNRSVKLVPAEALGGGFARFPGLYL